MRRSEDRKRARGSTTEVLTEGIEGLRLHLFRPSTLPAGPHRSLSLSPGICDGGRGQSHLQRSLHLFFAHRRETGERWRLHLPWAHCGLCGPPGEGGCWSSTTLPRGSHSGRPQRSTSHVTHQLARLSAL